MTKIADIEGIGEKYQETLGSAGIDSVEDLLENAGGRSGRKALAEKTGISEKLILKWVNMADLFRIKGVAGQYAELLEHAGVDTVKELATRNAGNLHEAMTTANETKKVAGQVPALKIVESWVTEAKSLSPKVSH